MIFGRFFKKKGYRDLESRGDDYHRQQRYADARIEYETALELLHGGEGVDDPDALRRIGEKLAATGLELARLNLAEARSALCAGNRQRCDEFLELAAQFSEAPEIRRQIAEIMKSAPPSRDRSNDSHEVPGRAKRSPEAVEPIDSSHEASSEPDEEIRFELYVSTLPGNLPDRYRAKGKDFARACLAAHEGRRREAWEMFRRLEPACDLVRYEMGLIAVQEGDPRSAEELLLDSLSMEPRNPLALLSLGQLRMVQRRHDEARTILQTARDQGLGNQILLLLGDNEQAAGAMAAAEAFYLEALADKSLARAAAERLIPIMESTGRTRERDFLLKKHCGKGCC